MGPHYEFQVLLHRIGRWWAVDIPRLDLHSQCRTLDRVEDLARGLVAEAVGAPPEMITLDILVPELVPLLDSVVEARRRRAAAVAAENQAIVAAVHELHMSQGDVERLLGMPPSEVVRFMPPRGSSPVGPGQLTPLPASGSAAAGRHSCSPLAARPRTATTSGELSVPALLGHP
ncbi:hypothetical protein [Streptomyces sp. NPDC093261]|uniref:hypothetical protein n=1 Tax=Streptomyces sp. NPDC093261 TaxID=3366037 RepID=UPI00381E5A8F